MKPYTRNRHQYNAFDPAGMNHRNAARRVRRSFAKSVRQETRQAISQEL